MNALNNISKTIKKKSNIYKHVNLHYLKNGDIKYSSALGSGKYLNTEREAALAVDKYLIKQGKEPINILKRK